MATNRSPRPNPRSSAQRGLTIIGSLAVIAALVLVAVIFASVSNATSQNATQIAQIPTLAIINSVNTTNNSGGVGTPVPVTPLATTAASTIVPSTATTVGVAATIQPSDIPTIQQVVEVLGATAVPVVTGTPVPLPPLPFQPLAGRSFYMARLGLSGPVPVVDLPIVNQTWDVNKLSHNVGHLQATNWVDPHQGNVVLVGHIQLAATDFGPFVYLNKAQVGDLVYVSDNGQVYTYQVTTIQTVNPTDVTVTYMTPQPILTLITCTTWDQTHGLYAQRLVVIAKLVNAPSPTT